MTFLYLIIYLFLICLFISLLDNPFTVLLNELFISFLNLNISLTEINSIYWKNTGVNLKEKPTQRRSLEQRKTLAKISLSCILKLLTFALAVLQIFDTCVSNVKLWSMFIPKRLTDLADSSWNPSIFILKGLCLPSNIYWNYPGFIIIWLFLSHFNTIFRSDCNFSTTISVVSLQ